MSLITSILSSPIIDKYETIEYLKHKNYTIYSWTEFGIQKVTSVPSMLILEISSSCCCMSSFLILSESILEASILMSTDRSTLGLSVVDSVLNPKKLLRLLALLLLFKLDPLEDFGIGLNKVGSRLQTCLLACVGLVLQWITGGLRKRGFSNDRLEVGNAK